ncbi:MAG: winged helix-turn-helix transcriptional regulator [Dehalococcoidia bacterium]
MVHFFMSTIVVSTPIPHLQAGPDDEPLTAFCPTFAHAMDILGRRWTGLILRVLLTGPHRFNEILALVPGLSDPLLTQRLRDLETEGLLVRHVLPTSPVRVEYELTDKGRDLERVVRSIADWASRWHIEADNH